MKTNETPTPENPINTWWQNAGSHFKAVWNGTVTTIKKTIKNAKTFGLKVCRFFTAPFRKAKEYTNKHPPVDAVRQHLGEMEIIAKHKHIAVHLPGTDLPPQVLTEDPRNGADYADGVRAGFDFARSLVKDANRKQINTQSKMVKAAKKEKADRKRAESAHEGGVIDGGVLQPA